jgi:hypothetical protein
MSDDEGEYTRGALMDTEPLTAVVKEDADGNPFLALEPGMLFLKFRRPTTIEEADKAAKWLRETFDISTPAPYHPPPVQGTPEDFERGPVN